MLRAILLAVVLLIVPAAPLAAQLPSDQASFIADGTVQIGGDRLQYRVFHKAGLERQEMSVDGLFQITILRPDLDTAYILQPGAAELYEVPLEEVQILPTGLAIADYKIEPLGPEKEGGEATMKFRLVSPEGALRRADVLLWMTEDGITMRMEGELEFEGEMENILLLHRNVRRIALDQDLFDPEIARTSSALE